MFDDFSADAELVIQRAREEARQFGRTDVRTEEILLGLTCVAAGKAWNVLKEFGVNYGTIIGQLGGRDWQSDGFADDPKNAYVHRSEFARYSLPFTERAQLVFRRAIKEAGSGIVYSEHILMALLAVRDCGAVGLLRKMNVDLHKLEDEVFLQMDYRDAKGPTGGTRPATPSKAPPARPGSSHWEAPTDSRPSSDKALAVARPAETSSWFTESARNAMDHALDQATQLRHNFIGTEHILLGLVNQGTECTTKTFQYTKVNPKSVLNQVKTVVGKETVEAAEVELIPAARDLLERSRHAMSQCAQELIDCEHLLFAIIQGPETNALSILQNLNVDSRILKEILLFYMEKTSANPGSSIIGRLPYSGTKEILAEESELEVDTPPDKLDTEATGSDEDNPKSD